MHRLLYPTFHDTLSFFRGSRLGLGHLRKDASINNFLADSDGFGIDVFELLD